MPMTKNKGPAQPRLALSKPFNPDDFPSAPGAPAPPNVKEKDGTKEGGDGSTAAGAEKKPEPNVLRKEGITIRPASAMRFTRHG